MPTLLVIIGITGDLSRRKLLPALEKLIEAKTLADPFLVIGITRKAGVTPESLLGNVSHAESLRDHLRLFSTSLADSESFAALSGYLLKCEKELGARAKRLFYLSVPPDVSHGIIEELGKSGLSRVPDTKLLLEKPFGTDLENAKDLIAHINRSFAPEQVYRIDHYLAKDMAQNLIVFRRDNPLFRRTWNTDFIEKIDIVASESIDIEGRVSFYESTGALRDLVQSHLLQLAALTLMPFSDDGNTADIPHERLFALQKLQVVPGSVVRGQYEGYRDEVKNPDSKTETFVSLALQSSDPVWKNVPITITTGKALAGKRTTILLTYRAEQAHDPNMLTIRLQPDEGVELCVFAKQSDGEKGPNACIPLSFTYASRFPSLPDAYERVFQDALKGDHALFVSNEEVLAAWRIIDPIQKEWHADSSPLVSYPKGAAYDTIR